MNQRTILREVTGRGTATSRMGTIVVGVRQLTSVAKGVKVRDVRRLTLVAGLGFAETQEGGRALRMPWRILLRRWWPCWRLTRHRLNYYHSSTREWAECYCGWKKENRAVSPADTTEGTG